VRCIYRINRFVVVFW